MKTSSLIVAALVPIAALTVFPVNAPTATSDSRSPSLTTSDADQFAARRKTSGKGIPKKQLRKNVRPEHRRTTTPPVTPETPEPPTQPS